MAMAAASQLLSEEGLSDSSSLEDDVIDMADRHAAAEEQRPQMVFNTSLASENEDDSDESPFSENAYEVEVGEDMDFSMIHQRVYHHNDGDGGGGDDDSRSICSAPSAVGSEELDEFVADPMPLDYQWRNPRGSRSSVGLEEYISSDFSTSASSETWEGELSSEDFVKARRPSFKQTVRRSSYTSSDASFDASFHSAPARADPSSQPPLYGVAEGGGGKGMGMERRRPLSIAVPNAEGAAISRVNSQRRTSVKIKSLSPKLFGSVGGGSTSGGDDDTSSSGGLLGFRKRSSRRQNLSVQVRSGAMGNLDNAIESLRKQDSNSEWENVAAAVTVVAASSQGGGNPQSRHIKFAVNDTVLVFLTLLNVTNMEDPKDTFTVAPVNKYGFSHAEGRTDLEKTGPYTFVLATVKHVHFDEDDRYYTVVRADTGTEQRSDSGT
jgi:hypothetical protein